MPILPGQTIRAAPVNALKTVTYYAPQTSSVAAGSTNVLVPGCTVTFDTLYANATFLATWFLDVDLTGASTSLASARLNIDGVRTGQFAVSAAEVSTDRSSPGNQYYGTLAAAGSHTIFLDATTGANVTLNLYSTLTIEVTENAP